MWEKKETFKVAEKNLTCHKSSAIFFIFFKKTIKSIKSKDKAVNRKNCKSKKIYMLIEHLLKLTYNLFQIENYILFLIF